MRSLSDGLEALGRLGERPFEDGAEEVLAGAAPAVERFEGEAGEDVEGGLFLRGGGGLRLDELPRLDGCTELGRDVFLKWRTWSP
ncbi:MAG: hypothetical protein IPN03_07630 [Holophagales bacterium]|nr:hypothetical protein [Holophagales bacterium]